MSACSFFPDQGVGQLLAPFIMKHVYMIYHVPPIAEAVPVITDAAQALLATPSVVESLSEVIVSVAESTMAALSTPAEAVSETLGAKPNMALVAASEVVAAVVEETATAAGAAAEAAKDAVTGGAETLATTLSSAVLDGAATTAALTKAAVENLSNVATVADAEASAVRFITVDSVPAHVVEAALATASAAMSAALESSTATS